MQLPDTVAGLLALLDRLVPEQVPSLGTTLEEIHRYAGKRELVLHLKRLAEAPDRAAAAPPRKPRGS